MDSETDGEADEDRKESTFGLGEERGAKEGRGVEVVDGRRGWVEAWEAGGFGKSLPGWHWRWRRAGGWPDSRERRSPHGEKRGNDTTRPISRPESVEGRGGAFKAAWQISHFPRSNALLHAHLAAHTCAIPVHMSSAAVGG